MPRTKLVRSDHGNDDLHNRWLLVTPSRKLYELHVAESSKVATGTVERMAKLWPIQETVRRQSPNALVAVRQQTPARCHQTLRPLVEGVAANFWQIDDGRSDPLRHLAPCLLRALPSGRLPRGSLQHRRASNQVPVNYQKNPLFAGSNGDGRSLATIATLLQTKIAQR